MKRKEPSVFEKYAHEYDLITNATEREKPHRREIDALIERYQPTSVLDAGCATGLTTYLFASRGIPAVGLDIAPNMLEIARQKYASTSLPIKFVRGDFEKLPRSLHRTCDMVVCLANSISGVPTIAGLKRTLNGFRSCLVERGYLIIQILNLSGLKDGEIFPIRTTRNGDVLYTRFSERVGKSHTIHVIRHDLATQPPSYEIFRHSYAGFSRAQMLTALRQCRFSHIELYGKLDLSAKFTRTSRDIVFVARS